MAFSYSTALTADKDKIRLRIGDTIDRGAYSLDDAEITYILLVQPVLGYAAAACARTLAARYANQADTENDELKVWASQRFAQLSKLATQLEKNPNLFSGKTRPSPIPFFGGVHKSESDTVAGDSDLKDPWFQHERFDNPGTSDGDDDG